MTVASSRPPVAGPEPEMRALFIGPNLAAGGAERQWATLLPGLRARGIDARLIALDGGGPVAESLERAGVPLEILDMRNRLDLGPVLRSPTLRRFRPDVVVTRGISGLYVGQAIARWRRARHVYNEHRGRGLVLSARREAMVRAVGRRLDLVVAVSEDQTGPWLARGCPRERVLTIPNGVPAPSVSASAREIRQTLGIPEPAVVATLVATLRPEKRVLDFATAVIRAAERHPELVGVVVGDGPERPALERAVRETAAVRLLGHRDDVERVLKASDLLVLSSEHEAAPMSILEAMAAGLPVIATAVGGIPGMVEDGATGLLVAPGDPEKLAEALVELAGDPQRRRAMGARARELHRERWHSELMIARYADALRAVTGPRPGQTNQGDGTAPSS